jgi:hypothetical protein
MNAMIWHMMREAAIGRHRMINVTLEGGCPIRWEGHMAVIRAFYGY